MKKTHQSILLSVLLGAALLPFGASAQTYQTSDYTNSFPNNGNTGLYQAPSAIYWYSIYQDYGLTVPPNSYNYPATNDAAMDADGDTNDSGSLYQYVPFNATQHDQDVFYFTLSDLGPYDQSLQIPISLVTNISFKIRVDPHSKPNTSGNFGLINVGLIGQLAPGDGYSSGANSSYYQPLTIPGAATNGWVTLSQTNVADFQNFVDGTGVTNAFGVDFDYNSYSGYPTSPVAFWIDDVVVLTSSTPPPPPPPPVMSLTGPLAPGLNLFAGQGTGLNQRENLESVNADYSWVGVGHPVSLSFTIANFPVALTDQFQTQIFLIPNPGTESAPDYTETNAVFLDLESTATGGASWMFRYKTNEPNGNGMIYGVGTLATIANTTAVGTWTVTFNNNTNITMMTPSGTSTNFSIPDTTGATAELFDPSHGNNVALYFGVQANSIGGANDHITVSDFSASGFGSQDFNDNFVADDGVLNTSIWETNANYAPAVQLMLSQPGNQYFVVNWSSPALNYNLLASSDLNATNNWQPFMINGSVPAPTRFGVTFNQIVNTNELPGGNAFFELVQPGQ